jgi:hypothetical protein
MSWDGIWTDALVISLRVLSYVLRYEIAVFWNFVAPQMLWSAVALSKILGNQIVITEDRFHGTQSPVPQDDSLHICNPIYWLPTQ